jgi:hypothetical protein
MFVAALLRAMGLADDPTEMREETSSSELKRRDVYKVPVAYAVVGSSDGFDSAPTFTAPRWLRTTDAT